MNRLRPAGEEPSKFRAIVALPLSLLLTINFIVIVYQIVTSFEGELPQTLSWGLIPVEIAVFTGLAYLIPWVAKQPVPWLVFSYAAVVIVLHFVFVIGLVPLTATMVLHFRLFMRERERKGGPGKRLRTQNK